MSHDVSQLDASGLTDIARSLTRLHKESASTMEEISSALVGHLYDLFCAADDGQPQCAMVRLFKTCSRDELPADLLSVIPEQATAETRFLCLLGTRGETEEWNSRHTSKGHRLISLESVEIVESIPMISNLIKMLGLNLNDVVKPNPDLNVAGFYPLSVFYVDEAITSPYIPAKEDFVIPYKIHSVVGFGGLLSYSDMFTIIMFFKVPVTREQATLFKILGDQVQELLAPFQVSGAIFSQGHLL